MADEFRNNNNQGNQMSSPNGNGRPMLKKVKRPVNKLMHRPEQPERGNNQNGQSQPNPQREKNVGTNIIPETKYTPVSNQLPKKQYNQEPPQFVSEHDLIDNQSASSLMQGDLFTKKALIIAVLFMFFIGFMFAKLFFSEQKIVNDGLQGVIANPEVPRGRARCGIAEKTQGCVLYIMNPQRQDLNARDFYDLASQLTGRQRFVIETGNMRYSNVKVSPGEIAQFNIPPLQ